MAEISTILKTKLHRPVVTDDLINRDQIVDLLEKNIHKPLSLISAPAGYGKSTVVSQWLEKTHAKYTWITLDEGQNEIKIFLDYFTTAINKIFPESLAETNLLLTNPVLPPDKIILQILINELDNIHEDFILVLDDFHRINNEKITWIINELLKFPPENMHLSLITRRDPAISINKLRSQNRTTEVRMQDLAFSEKEVQYLFNKLKDIKLKNNTVRLLRQKTEGWIVGIRLALITMKKNENIEQFVERIKGDFYTIAEFLLEEVLMIQPKEFQETFLSTSLLDRFCPELVDEIISTKSYVESVGPNGEQFIEELLRSNLFIISLDHQNKWFRYHHLFQQLLQNQLNKHYTKEEIKNFHNKASDWFVKNEYISEGIHHAIKANNLSQAKEIVEQNWVSALNNEQWVIVQSWLTFLPEKIIEHSISLLVLKAQIYYIRNRLIDIPAILNHIKQLEQNPNDLEKGSIASFQSILSFVNGNGKEALDFSEKALKLIPLQFNRFRSDVESWWALFMHMVGKMDHAIKKINTSMKNLYPPGEPIRLSRLIAQKIMISLLDANLSLAEYNIKDFEKIKGLSIYAHTFGEYFRACIGWWKYSLYNEINEFDSVIKNRFHVEASLGLDAYIAKAHALMELNRPEEAIEFMDKALEHANETKIEENVTIIKSGYARIALLQGNIDSAENWFNTIRVPEINPFVLFWIEVPAITYCRLLIAKGSDADLNKALKLLAEYRIKVESWHNNLRTLEIASLQALANQKMGNEEKALKNLKYSIELSGKSELIRPIIELGDPIIQVLNLIKNENFQPEYIDKIIYNIGARESKKILKQKSTPFNGSISVRHKKSETLSIRELEIIQLVSKGYRNKEIAQKLYVEEVTIKKHLYNIFQKMQVKNRIEMANRAKELDGYFRK